MTVYTGKLKTLRQYVRTINGLAIVPKRKVEVYLSKEELRRFEKKYPWYKCFVNVQERRFVRGAYFWHLERILHGNHS